MKRRVFVQGCAAFGASAVLLPKVSILEASEPKGETRVFIVKIVTTSKVKILNLLRSYGFPYRSKAKINT